LLLPKSYVRLRSERFLPEVSAVIEGRMAHML